jgi:FdhE protein
MDESSRRWIAQHSFLEGVAAFHDAVEGAVAKAALPAAPAPAAGTWEADHARKVPLLHSAAAGLASAPALGEAVAKLAFELARSAVPEPIKTKAVALRDAIASPAARAALVRSLVEDGEPPEGVDPGFTRFVAWTALAHALAPAIRAVAASRDDDAWNSGCCPTCGAAPGMTQLVPNEVGRKRILACGQCRTRWAYRRIACPHCANEDANQLAVLELEGEPALRLDVCEACKGYVKTYTETGDEPLMLADWSSLHLDVLASEKGFERKGASLYELE